MPTDGAGNAKVERRLAAILAADIAGYSALMGSDDARTVRDLKGHQAVVLPMISDHGGRIIDTAGDGILAEFGSVVNAVECAVALQTTMAKRNSTVEASRQMQFRIGINLGDVIHDETRVYGDGINIAARLESAAEPGGICISGKVYDEIAGRVGVVCQDLGFQSLKNISQPIRVYKIEVSCTPSAAANIKSAQKPAFTIPDKPSIAVLPFTNLSGDPKEDYFSDGITEDIITELSRFSELFVIARNSSFQYKGKSPDIRQVGRDLGVRYVLEGSIRRGGDRVRITAQLIDASTGAHRWAERYDRELKDVFAVQDELARTIAVILAAHLNKAETERALLKAPMTWRAYDYYMRAAGTFASFWSSMLIEELYETRRLLEAAIELDPNYARPYTTLSFTYIAAAQNRVDDDFMNPAALHRARELALRAIQIDPNSPDAHAGLGAALTWMSGQNDATVAAFEKAFSLNPNFRDWRFAWALVYAGEPTRSIQFAETNMRLDPYYPPLVPGFLGFAHYFLKQYTKGLPLLNESTSRAPNQRGPHLWLAATYAQMGRLEEARFHAAEVLRILPEWTIGVGRRTNQFKFSEHAEHYVDGLRKAGLPEN
jgi:adenylate cyclase